MNREIMNGVSMDASLMSTTAGSLKGLGQRVHDRLDRDSLNAASSPEESFVVDDRCDLSPAQMVETKLTRVLGGATLPVSHLQMRGLLRKR
jgi:hypothetical protein